MASTTTKLTKMNKLNPKNWKKTLTKSPDNSKKKDEISNKAITKFKNGLINGNTSQIRKFLQRNPNQVNVKYLWHNYSDAEVFPLHVTAVGTRADLVSLLLENHADVHAITDSGKNALHYCASSNGCNADIIDRLINKGIDINLLDDEGNTPLMVAVICNNVGVVRRLVENFSDLAIPNSDGDLPLEVAKKKKLPTIIGLLSKTTPTNTKTVIKEQRYDNMEDLKDLKTELISTRKEIVKLKAEFVDNMEQLKQELKVKNEAMVKLDESRNELMNSFNQSQSLSHYSPSPTLSKKFRRSSITCGFSGLESYSTDPQRRNLPSLRSASRISSTYSVQSVCSGFEKNLQDQCLSTDDLVNEGMVQEDSDEEDEDMPIGAQERYNIQKHYGQLISYTHIDRVLIPMFEKMLFTPEIKEHIDNLVSTRVKNDYILLKVILPGTKRKLLKFLQILEATDQSHVADIIRNGSSGHSSLSIPYSGIRHIQHRKFTQSDSNLNFTCSEDGSQSDMSLSLNS